MTAKVQLREAYDIAVENASTIKEKWNAFYRWTINECGKLVNELKEQGYDTEALSTKTMRNEIKMTLNQKWKETHGSLSSQRQLPRRKNYGVRGLYDELEKAGFDMSSATISWGKDDDCQVE